MSSPPPQTYEELKADISARCETLSKRLRTFAHFALANPNDMAFETIAVIAGRAQVQPSSLIRFAKAFGYDGFSDMQRIFRARLIERSPSYAERIHAIRREHGDGADGSPLAVLNGVVSAGIVSLEHVRDETTASVLDRAVALLDAAREIHVIGHRRSFPIASYLSYGLNRINVRAHLMDGVGGLVFEQARLFTPEDALLAVSFRDYAKDVVEIVKSAHGQGIPVVAITDSPFSPLAACATACLEVHYTEFQAFRSLAASMCLAQTLVISLGCRIEARAERSRRGRRGQGAS